MSAKYQVFLSSTYEDLRAERDQVIRAVLEMGHIPVGMEMFSAADDEQWKIIARHIDESDYYVVLIAHRYGSVVDDGTSYTEKEYDYAVSKGVPVIGFVIDKAARWPADFIESERDKRTALDAFKDKVRKKPVGSWSSAADLYGKVPIALMKLFTANQRPGWVRATGAASPEMISELTRLSSENARLREQVAAISAKASSEAEQEHEARRVLHGLSRVTMSSSIWCRGASGWTKGEDFTLLNVFLELSPQLLTEYSSSAASNLLALSAARGKPLRDEWPMPSNMVNQWLGDLMAYGLVEPSGRKHAVADKEHYWTLTEKGRSVYAFYRRFAHERSSEEVPDPTSKDSANEADLQKREATASQDLATDDAAADG